MIHKNTRIKIIFIGLGLIFMTVTLFQDYLKPDKRNSKPLPNSANHKKLEHSNSSSESHGEDLNHNHKHKEENKLSSFDKLPAPVPDPIKQRRMGIHHYNEGNKFLKEGKWKLAIENYEMALAHDTEIYQVYLNMSNAFLMGEQWDRALQTLKTLETKKPDLPSLHYNLACYYSLNQQIENSLSSIKRAVELGYKPKSDILNDADLEFLRKSQAFQKWVDNLK